MIKTFVIVTLWTNSYLLNGGEFATSREVEDLNHRVEELASQWSEEFLQYKQYHEHIKKVLREIESHFRQVREKEYAFPESVGFKLELLDSLIAEIRGGDNPPCPKGSFSAVMRPKLANDIGEWSLCVRSSRNTVDDMIKWEGTSADCERTYLLLNETRMRKPDDLIIDVGANIGTCTGLFAQTGYNVLAIEPLPSSFKLLEASVASWKSYRRVRTVNAAVTDDSHASTLRMIEFPYNAGSAQINPFGMIEVQTVFLPDIVPKNICIPLVKLDCEGCEFQVLKSLVKTGLIDFVEIIKSEFYPELLSKYESSSLSPIQLLQLFDSIDFTVYVYNNESSDWRLIQSIDFASFVEFSSASGFTEIYAKNSKSCH